MCSAADRECRAFRILLSNRTDILCVGYDLNESDQHTKSRARIMPGVAFSPIDMLASTRTPGSVPSDRPLFFLTFVGAPRRAYGADDDNPSLSESISCARC
jgi:hypothetical protein